MCVEGKPSTDPRDGWDLTTRGGDKRRSQTAESMANTEPAWRRSNRSVLLLQRRSKHNDKKWGLPGGNAEDADASLLETAKREAAEEMGDVPDFTVTGVVETRSVCSLFMRGCWP